MRILQTVYQYNWHLQYELGSMNTTGLSKVSTMGRDTGGNCLSYEPSPIAEELGQGELTVVYTRHTRERNNQRRNWITKQIAPELQVLLMVELANLNSKKCLLNMVLLTV
ncbi:hypothetical protein CBL_11165 [Carabus blaptoides fortunei]